MLLRLLRRLWVKHRVRARVRRPVSRPRVEGLEDRMLMASGLDVFWNFHADIAVGGERDAISVPFRSGDVKGPGKTPLIGFFVQPAPGSFLDPTAVALTQSGAAVAPVLATDNTDGNLASLTLARVRSRALAVDLGGLGAGGYQLELFLAGDVDGSNKVKRRDLNLIAAALGQVPGNPDYRVEADVDRNGIIDQTDLDLAASNLNARAKRNPMVVSVSINPADDPDGDGIVEGTIVRLLGQTSKKATVRLDANGDGVFEQTVRASKKKGRFGFTADIGTGNVFLIVEVANSKGQTARQLLTMLRGGPPTPPPPQPPAPGRTITGDVSVATEAELQALSDVIAITGSLTIQNTSLTNLEALSRLGTVGGNLVIQNNADLASLLGLRSLTSVGSLQIISNGSVISNSGIRDLTGLGNLSQVQRSIVIAFNPLLANVDALAGVRVLTDAPTSDALFISGNPALVSLNGLSGLTQVIGQVTIESNTALPSLLGLHNLTSVSGLRVRENRALTTLTHLSNLSGAVHNLHIGGTDGLPNLAGLAGITRVTGSLQIFFNNALAADSLDGLNNISAIDGGVLITGNIGFSDEDAWAYVNGRTVVGTITIGSNTTP